MMLLSPDDLKDLTGRERPSAQIRWLRDHGWRFDIGADGRPKVSRLFAEAKLGGQSTPREPALRLA